MFLLLWYTPPLAIEHAYVPSGRFEGRPKMVYVLNDPFMKRLREEEEIVFL